jgi:hypothetical protein
MSSNTYLRNLQKPKTSIEERIRKEREELKKKREIEKKYEKYLENILFDGDDNDNPLNIFNINLLKSKLTLIGLKYPYDDIDRYLQRKEIQDYITELKIRIKLDKEEGKKSNIIRNILDNKSRNLRIGRKTIDSKILEELSKYKSDIYKKVIKKFEKEESNLDKELKRTTGIIKDISGLSDEEFEAIINTVLKATNERINNKKEYLQLTEKIIEFLNKSLSKSPLIIDLPLEEFKQKYI